LSVASLLWIGIPASAQSPTQQAQPTATRDNDTTVKELSSFDGFLDNHSEIAEQLRKDPSQVKNEQFLEQHPELQQYLRNHPGVQEEISENPRAFMHEERGFERQETRGELSRLDAFLDHHPEIAEQLRKNPSLVNDRQFLQQHPELQRFLQDHGNIAAELRRDPNLFMREEQRFDQREDGRYRDMTHGQLASMDRFLDSHPEVAEQLRKDPALVNDKKFVDQHPALQSYLQQHPGVRAEFSENPNGVMQQEQHFDQRGDGRDRDLTRGQLASLDRFLDSHPEVAEQLRKNPSLVNDKKFVDQHPALQSYLQQHPGVREEFGENPNAFMRQEQHFDRQEDYGRGTQGFDRDGGLRSEAANFGQFLGVHANIAAQISKDPSLVNNKEFMESHPELRDYLKTHPAAQAQLQQNPQAFLQSAQQTGSKAVPKAPPVAQPLQKQR
jgi:phage-related protein